MVGTVWQERGKMVLRGCQLMPVKTGDPDCRLT